LLLVHWEGNNNLHRTVQRVKELGKRVGVDRIKPGCDVEVDGGIDAITAPLAVEAGASVLVAGSAIFGDRGGVVAAMKRLRASVEKAVT
jgi:ribulose-phosphate 3-epimerase